ncbi:cytochrome P450 [Bradyrhizobium sp. 2S1]|uniref:cytochrome P450 n=1 Tax=Bradyrhizobium sp. 2S1 TaxID=1404429 RepID=UPI00140D028F|nr:cytochrome P450 [Bradyrhizobium sp. 2S1]MCK7673411.1 cytochrome P450 [Bradyrhizobium sp. 2S1]
MRPFLDSSASAKEWPLPAKDLTDLDLFTRGFPHALFTELRRYEGPLFHPATALTPGGEGFWVVSRYRDMVPIARDHVAFSSESGGDREGGGTMIEDLPRAVGVGSVINMMDDPRHRALLRLVAPGLTHAKIAALEPVLAEAARVAVADVLTRGHGDLVKDIAAELPLLAIASLLGIPAQDRHQIFAWINAVLDYADRQLGETSQSSAQAMQQFMAYGQCFVESRRQAPGEDVVSLAVTGELRDGLGRLSPVEQLMVFNVVMVAGLETTRNAIAGGVLAFIECPEQWTRLREERTLINPALEEILRWTSPTPYNRRTATRDVEIGGRLIRRGEKVTLWWASANRDEGFFERPFDFDVGRSINPHLAFGSGGHGCLGAQLARLEMRVVLNALLDHVAGFDLAGDVEWVRSNKHTGIRRMPVRYTPAPSHPIQRNTAAGVSEGSFSSLGST